jgi:phospholipase/lecithinase/hemolysin
MKFRRCALIVTLILFATFAITLQLTAQANNNPNSGLVTGGPRPQVIAYGDSLSDNGNIYKILGFPGPPYWEGRWSNGPVAVENMAAILGMPLVDNAYAAATAGIGNAFDGGTPEQLGSLGLPGITTAYNNTINSMSQDTIRRSLFVISGGSPNFLEEGFTTAAADEAVENLIAVVRDLQKRGARWILVPGMLDWGMAPAFTSQGPDTAAQDTLICKYFNQRLLARLPKGVLYFDTFSLYEAMGKHPGAFGLKDVVDSCLDPNTGAPCSNPNEYLFWDGLHPTENVQIILAVGFALAAHGTQ